MRILIAEDDFTLRGILSGVLKKNNHEVIEAINGLEVWVELQKKNAPKLVILDWIMPEMDGLEVLTRVRSLKNMQPPYIIMLTIKNESTNVISALDAGANDYLSKPFDIGELRARIGVGIRMIEMQEQLMEQLLELRQAFNHIKTLQGILPICSFCKKIRNDKGSWDQMEAYICQHSNAKFSHGVCPECLSKHYPE